MGDMLIISCSLSANIVQAECRRTSSYAEAKPMLTFLQGQSYELFECVAK